MKRSILYCILIVVTLLALTACACKHQWNTASCTEPKLCTLCNTTEGEPTGHSWVDASCTTPKICTLCEEVEGTALGHSWVDATCEQPKTCTLCAVTEGEAAGHSWAEWTRVETDAHQVCNICATENVITMSEYLIPQLQGYWLSTQDLLGGTVQPHKLVTMEINEDGTVGLFTPEVSYPACKLEYHPPVQSMDVPFSEEPYYFTLTANEVDNPINFFYSPQDGSMVGYQGFLYERESAETALVRELLQGQWLFDSFDTELDSLAELDHSGYTVEFYQGNKFIVNVETQLEGTWVYYPGDQIDSDGITSYVIIATIGEDWWSMYFNLEVHKDSGAMILRAQRPRVERVAFVKAP